MPPVQLLRQIFVDTPIYIIQFQERGVAEWVLGSWGRGVDDFVEMIFGATTQNPDAFPPEVLDVYKDAFRPVGALTPPIEYYRNMDRNWELTAAIADRTIDVPCLMISAANDPVLTPAMTARHGGARPRSRAGRDRGLRALDPTGTPRGDRRRRCSPTSAASPLALTARIPPNSWRNSAPCADSSATVGRGTGAIRSRGVTRRSDREVRRAVRTRRDALRADATRAGPWSPKALHGGAPSALFATVCEPHDPGPAAFVARVTVELMRPVPLAPLELQRAHDPARPEGAVDRGDAARRATTTRSRARPCCASAPTTSTRAASVHPEVDAPPAARRGRRAEVPVRRGRDRLLERARRPARARELDRARARASRGSGCGARSIAGEPISPIARGRGRGRLRQRRVESRCA